MTDDIPIWNDPDVMRIYQVREGRPFPMFHVFNEEPHQLALVRDWAIADQNAGSDGPLDAFVAACLSRRRQGRGEPGRRGRPGLAQVLHVHDRCQQPFSLGSVPPK